MSGKSLSTILGKGSFGADGISAGASGVTSGSKTGAVTSSVGTPGGVYVGFRGSLAGEIWVNNSVGSFATLVGWSLNLSNVSLSGNTASVRNSPVSIGNSSTGSI